MAHHIYNDCAELGIGIDAATAIVNDVLQFDRAETAGEFYRLHAPSSWNEVLVLERESCRRNTPAHNKTQNKI